MTASTRQAAPIGELRAAFHELDRAIAALIEVHAAPAAGSPADLRARELEMAEGRVRQARAAFTVVSGE